MEEKKCFIRVVTLATITRHNLCRYDVIIKLERERKEQNQEIVATYIVGFNKKNIYNNFYKYTSRNNVNYGKLKKKINHRQH